LLCSYLSVCHRRFSGMNPRKLLMNFEFLGSYCGGLPLTRRPSAVNRPSILVQLPAIPVPRNKFFQEILPPPPGPMPRWPGEKHKVPARPCGRTGTKWGMGVRHTLFPVLAFGAELAASFPTLFSTASGVFGLVAGPSSILRRWIIE